VPSKINLAFKSKRVNAAFISSITSSKCKCTDVGIVAHGAVYSVFVIEGEEEIDIESATSNQLAKVLGIKGRVIIGDKALKHYLEGNSMIDLSKKWKDDTKLPFVFARLCYNGYNKEIESIAKEFVKSPIKIPQTILKKEAKKRDIKVSELRWYLNYIHYHIDNKSQRSLKMFLKKTKVL
jgi:chorismate dehydratase